MDFLSNTLKFASCSFLLPGLRKWEVSPSGVASLVSPDVAACMAGETSLSRIHSLSMWVSQEGSHSALCFTCWEKGTLDTEDPQVEARGEGSVGLGETGEGAQEVIK